MSFSAPARAAKAAEEEDTLVAPSPVTVEAWNEKREDGGRKEEDPTTSGKSVT